MASVKEQVDPDNHERRCVWCCLKPRQTALCLTNSRERTKHRQLVQTNYSTLKHMPQLPITSITLM